MTIETWSYAPGGIAVEEISDPATRLSRTGPQSTIVGQAVIDTLRGFEVSFPHVESLEVRSLSAFFRQRRGSYEAFWFESPLDQGSYLVRFDSDLRIDNFTVNYFRSNPLKFMLVTS